MGALRARNRVWRIEHKPMAIATNKMSDAGSQTDILGDIEECPSTSKQDHTKVAASDSFNNPG